MNIAYYEENNYHTEIIGTFIEPFKSDNITVFNDADKSGYVNWYKKIINFDIKPTDKFIDNCNDYDVIIIGTSNTFKFYDLILNKINEKNINEKTIIPKIYFINHLKEDAIKNINFDGFVLTPLNIMGNLKYILPVNNFYQNKNKKLNKVITICLVGRFKDINRNYVDLIKLINNHSDLNFKIVIYTRHKKFIPDKLFKIQQLFRNKLIIYYNSSTEEIINNLENITYFCPLSSKDSCYTKDRLTGMIPFSLNFNTPLILDENTNLFYNLKSPIVYKDSLCEIIENVCNMDKNDYDKLLLNTVAEKEEICQNNYNLLFELFDTN